MGAKFAVTALVVGWVGLWLLGHPAAGEFSWWLPYAALGWFLVTALVVIRVLFVRGMKR